MSEESERQTAVPAVPTQFKRAHIIINPAAGKDNPILNTLNDVFQEAHIEWDVSITKKADDAERLARAAVESGIDVVAAYGGDGTILGVANGMRGSDVPLIILPGGTGNVIAIELGIPLDLADATRLLVDGTGIIKEVDMGELDGRLFFHLGLGLEGQMIREADREAKDSSGLWAYITSAMKAISDPPKANYRLVLDGHEVREQGINCMVTNFGSIGVAGLKLSHKIDMTDGKFDVIIIRKADMQTVLAAVKDALVSGEVAQALLHWQAREVTIEADPPQPLTMDGEEVEVENLTARVVPAALRVVIPPPVEESDDAQETTEGAEDA